ncbi:L,D-transpeptidase family protein [Cucumibacter marinus]|uniref:L,D-transpeptidase family protein n=1 Tax=Cucumibacter marinus TaxID=1121252 RepID=UPI0004163B7F|nr:L,D-transpeptidase family protein [Cucumibacter marinus]
MRIPFLNLPICLPRLLVGVLVIAGWILGMLAADARAQTASDPRDLAVVRLNLIDLLENEPRLPLPVQQRRESLLEFYSAQDTRFIWLGTTRGQGLVDRLSRAEIDGLRPGDYPSGQLQALVDAAPRADLRGQAVIELHLSAAMLEYASDLHVGRFLPSRIDPNFFLQKRSIDQVAALNAAMTATDMDAFFAGMQPSAEEYRDLRNALAGFRQLRASGGWPAMPFGETLKPGMDDPRVADLRARLGVRDPLLLLAEPGTETVYDEALVAAVEKFQAEHGLDVDGAVGPATVGALNVTIDDRIASIEVAMERWRWMPEDLGAQYVFVNIAGFELKRVRNDVVEERMNVVVGKPYSRTPVFSDRIRYLEFNPYWNVPSSIALDEQLQELRANPARLASQGFEAVSGDQVYDLRSIDWRQFGPGNFPFQIRQRPGANNALGRVKLMFPNPHNVYLHDTPSRSLFSRSERAFSHGCVRLQRPLDLAQQVLAVGGVPGWDRNRIDSVLASGERTVVSLEQPIPVHIAYLTAWVEDGVPQFRADIYEHDRKLLAALDGKDIAW